MKKILVVTALGMMVLPSWGQTPPAQNGGKVTPLKTTQNFKNGDRNANYNLKLVGNRCVANFLYSSPNVFGIPHDSPHKGLHEYDAVPLPTGGVKCVNGTWKNLTSGNSGTISVSNDIIMIVKGKAYRER